MSGQTWQQRLKDLIKQRPDLSMKRLSLKAGLSESAVRDMVNRGREPSVENFIRVAEAAGVSPGYLLQGDERFRIRVPLLGITSESEVWTSFGEQPPKKNAPKTDFELGDHDVIAIEVRGDSMSPVYRDQDQLFCRRRTGAYVDNLIGMDCVIRTASGENYIKILAKGSRAGFYNLRSYDPTSKDLENVQIEWAAPIIWIRRGGR